MKIFKHFIIRLFIVLIPLTVLYFSFQKASVANSQSENPTDVGLGFAILLLFILIILSVGLTIDFIKRIRNNQYEIAMTDLPFLIIFLIPILLFFFLMR